MRKYNAMNVVILQVPTTMKAILQAGWLLTTATGNIIVIIVASAGSQMSQVPGLNSAHSIFHVFGYTHRLKL